jgi:hypothetical protein
MRHVVTVAGALIDEAAVLREVRHGEIRHPCC